MGSQRFSLHGVEEAAHSQAQGPQVAQEGQAHGAFISQQWSVVTTQISKTWQGRGLAKSRGLHWCFLGYPCCPWGRVAEGQGLWRCGWRSYLLDVWLQGAVERPAGTPRAQDQWGSSCWRTCKARRSSTGPRWGSGPCQPPNPRKKMKNIARTGEQEMVGVPGALGSH